MKKSKFYKLFVIWAAVAVALGIMLGEMPERRGIETVNMIKTVGLDRPDECVFTFVRDLIDGSDESKASQEAISTTAPTYSMASRKAKNITDKDIVGGYIRYFLIGEDSAKEDIYNEIDYICRNYELQLMANVYLVEGTAEEFLLKYCSGDTNIDDKLENMNKSGDEVGYALPVTLVEVLRMLTGEYQAGVIPLLRLEEYPTSINEDMKENGFLYDGYAVMRSGKMVGKLTREASRGYNFLSGKIRSTVIDATWEHENLAFEVTSSKERTKFIFDGDQLTGVKFTVDVSSNLYEASYADIEFSKQDLNNYETWQEAVIKREILEMLNATQELGADVLNLYSSLYQFHPKKAKLIEDWDEFYKELNFELEVNVKVARTYDVVSFGTDGKQV